MAHPDFARAWLRQRRQGAVAVDTIERRELAELDDETALAQIEAVLSLPTPSLPHDRLTSSGLVEQQRLFMRLRRQR